MPRIEIIPDNWESSPEAGRGDGTPTIDVCADGAHYICWSNWYWRWIFTDFTHADR